jgi:6-phosphogluconolactonase
MTHLSRRALLAGSAAFAAPSSGRKIQAYVGTYTPNGGGIHIFTMNPSNGVLTPVRVVTANSPSWLAFDPKKKFLYTANEEAGPANKAGSVTAYKVEADSGDLTRLNSASSEGAGPAHLSVDPSGKYVLVANYAGGNVAVLPISASGSVGPATDVKDTASACSPRCATGPLHPAKAPAGSFAISGHDAPHAHMFQTDPSGNFAIANDVGIDRTVIWRFDRVNGKLLDPKTVASSPGAGPRHFVFHPNGRWFYSLNEESSTIATLRWNAANGELTPVDEISTLPAGFAGTSFTSEVVITGDGKFVYALNRLHDSIAIFAVGSDGRLKWMGEVWTQSDYPRNCCIDPTGNFLFVCHNKSDNITSFRVHRGSGKLTFTGQYVPVGSASAIVFL